MTRDIILDSTNDSNQLVVNVEAGTETGIVPPDDDDEMIVEMRVEHGDENALREV